MNDKKRDKIEAMFDSIAPSYDMLNHVLSLNIDKIWRKKVVAILRKREHNNILDLATGTGDLAIAIARGIENSQVNGVDISKGMLAVAQKKIEKSSLNNRITLMQGDATALPFDDNSFDAVTVGFGVRNFEDLEKGLEEMRRILTDNGSAVILELSIPQNVLLKTLYKLYFLKILPIIGRLKSKSNSAYSYLPSSVVEFASGDRFIKIMQRCGYVECAKRALCGGIATIYSGKKG